MELKNTLRQLSFASLLTFGGLSQTFAHDGAHSHLPSLDSKVESTTLSDIAFLQRRLDLEPSDRLALSKRAALELSLARRRGEHEDYEVAEESFRQLLKGEVSVNGNVGLAYALIGQHRFVEALGFARQAAESAPRSGQVRALLGDLHFALGNYAEADLAYEALAAKGLSLPSLARQAQIEQHYGRLELAESLYADALRAGELLEAGPGRIAWCKTMIGDLALERGQIEAAEKSYIEALKMDPGAHAVIYRMAKVERLEGEFELARRMLTSLVESHPLPDYWIELGDVLADLGRHAESEKWFAMAEADMLSDLEHGDLGHVRQLAEFYVSHDRNVEQAVSLARLDLAQVRHDSGTYETLAWCLYRAGEPEEAMGHVRKALRSGQGSARLLRRAVEIFEANGLAPEAAHVTTLARDWNPAFTAN